MICRQWRGWTTKDNADAYERIVRGQVIPGVEARTGKRLRDELVEAAMRVLAAHGDTERLSIRAVAAEAHVTSPTVYRHFPGRPALVRTVVETCFDRFESELTQAEQGAADPFDALRRRCRAYVAFGERQPRLYRVMFGAWSAGPRALDTTAVARTPARARSPR
jgi:AcrR family transcriptional regulator